MQVFADGFKSVTLSNGNLRVTLVQNGEKNTVEDVATLIIPGNQAPRVINGLVEALKQLEEQIKAKREESDPVSASTDGEAN